MFVLSVVFSAASLRWHPVCLAVFNCLFGFVICLFGFCNLSVWLCHLLGWFCHLFDGFHLSVWLCHLLAWVVCVFLCKQHVCRLPGCMHFVLCSPFAVVRFSLLFPFGLCLFTVCFLPCLSAVCICLFWMWFCKAVLFCLLCLLVYQSGYLPNLVSALLICAVSLLFIVWRGLPVSLSARLSVFFWGALAWYCLLVFLPCVLLFVPMAFVCKSAVRCLSCACCPVLLCR